MSGGTIAACREAIKVSDETARRWLRIEDDGIHALQWTVEHREGSDLHGFGLGVSVAGMGRYGFTEDEAAFLAANDPATRLALNAALTVVLDGIEATLSEACYVSRLHDVEHAEASLAAVAQALGDLPQIGRQVRSVWQQGWDACADEAVAIVARLARGAQQPDEKERTDGQ